MKLWPRVGVGQGAVMDWARILAYVTGTVDQELLARNEYLAAENRILKVQLNGRLKLSDAERGVLGEIGHRLGRKVLADVATIARPDTILGWYGPARALDGGPGEFFWYWSGTFDSRQAALDAMASPEGLAGAADVPNYYHDDPLFMFFEK